MTKDVLGSEQLVALSPDLVSPALLALAGRDAPTRAIICAGAAILPGRTSL
jgi:hypothetical protein